MPENRSPETPSHAGVRYEKSDVRFGGIVAFGVSLLLLGLVVHVSLALMFDELGDRARRDDPPLPALAAKERPKLPRDLTRIPPPVLQQDEIADLKRLRDAEDRRLDGYGWVNAKTGLVHIPIAEAMRLLADPKFAEAHGIRWEAVTKKGGR
jgi:hypothetical protein